MKRLTKDSIITALQIVGIIGLLSYSAYKETLLQKKKFSMQQFLILPLN